MTRLVKDLLVLAEKDGFKVLSSKCLFREGSDPYLPFTDALKEFSDRIRGQGPENDVKEKDDVHTGLLPMGLVGIGGGVDETQKRKARARAREVTKRSGGTDFTKERERIFSVIVSVLSDLTDSQPVALFLDDLHWADTASLQLLSYVIRNSEDQRLLIIGAYRTAEVEARKGHPLKEVISRARREGRCTVIDLRPLKRDDTEAMIKSLLDVKKVPKPFSDLIQKETEGNPFFIEEVLRSLVEQELIPETGADLGKVELSKVKVPSSIADLIGRKVDSLDEEKRKVLEYAAVIGEEFDIDTLGKVMKIEEMELVDLLERLIQLQIVEELGESEDIRYKFTHKQFREVIYNNLSSARKRLAHKKVGLILEGLPKRQRDKRLFSLAHHLSMSAELDKAIEYTTQAAERAESSFAAEDAITYYENILELMDKKPPSPEMPFKKKVIVARIAELKFMTESWNEAVHYLQALEKVARSQEDEITLAEVYRKLGHIEKMRGNWTDAVEAYGRSLEIAEKINDEAGIAETLQGLGHIHAVRADYEVAKAYLEKSMDLSRAVKDTLSLGRSHIELGHVYREVGDYDEALGIYTEGLMLLEEAGDPYATTRGFISIGDLCIRMEDWDKAIDFYEKAQGMADKTKDVQMRAWAQFKLGECHAHKNDFDQAEVLCGKALMNILRTDDRVGLAYVYNSYGVVFKLKGDFGKAFVQFQQALNTAEDLSMPAVTANIFLELGLMYRDKEDKRSARRFFERGKKLYEKVEAIGLAEQADRLLEGLDRYVKSKQLGSAQHYLDKSLKAMEIRKKRKKGNKGGTKKHSKR